MLADWCCIFKILWKPLDWERERLQVVLLVQPKVNDSAKFALIWTQLFGNSDQIHCSLIKPQGPKTRIALQIGQMNVYHKLKGKRDASCEDDVQSIHIFV